VPVCRIMDIRQRGGDTAGRLLPEAEKMAEGMNGM